MKYRKKPVVIEATQWFENGDHPDDYTGMPEPLLIEGQVVRFFRRPDVDGHKRCEQCNDIMLSHGWIETLEGGHIVCPHDWIITDIKGEYYPCKPDIFEQTYELVED